MMRQLLCQKTLAHFIPAGLLAVLFGSVVTLVAAQPPAKSALTDETALRDLLKLKLEFSSYLFIGAKFPQCEFDNPAKAKELLGPYKINTTFYTSQFQKVGNPVSDGFYGAVVEVAPETGKPFRRYFTLYRITNLPVASWRYDPKMPADLTYLFGIAAPTVQREQELIVKELKGQWFEQMSMNHRAARLLAGLRLDKGSGPLHKYDDAFALERQWWVTLRRQITGMDKVFAKPFVCPQPKDGNPAPVVHDGTPAEAKVKPGTAEKMDAACQTWAADDDQAFAVCVVRHGVIVLHKAYGTRDGKPMTVDTKSWMASITKSMCATLMMELVDQGVVSLDDTVDKFVPAFRGVKVQTPMTIRHLYTHTAGLNVWPSEWYHDDQPDIHERIALAYPFLHVGKEWGYNGQSYTLAGKIIETVSGEAIPQFYHHHLLSPLGMTHTDVTGTHADAFSTPLDMAKFGQMLLNRGAYGKDLFLRPETFEQMLPQQLTKVLGANTKRTFGIGLDGTPQRIGHGSASAATFSVDLEKNLVVVMTRNKMGKNQDKYNGKFWQALKDGLE